MPLSYARNSTQMPPLKASVSWLARLGTSAYFKGTTGLTTSLTFESFALLSLGFVPNCSFPTCKLSGQSFNICSSPWKALSMRRLPTVISTFIFPLGETSVLVFVAANAPNTRLNIAMIVMIRFIYCHFFSGSIVMLLSTSSFPSSMSLMINSPKRVFCQANQERV